jgi:hypothetical protein
MKPNLFECASGDCGQKVMFFGALCVKCQKHLKLGRSKAKMFTRKQMCDFAKYLFNRTVILNWKDELAEWELK